MAEYIDKQDLEEYIELGYSARQILRLFNEGECPYADVIERFEYIELLKENKRLREELEAKSEALNSICQIHKEYVGKAIEEIKQLPQYIARFSDWTEIHVSLTDALNVLENIGE